ncbi:MAG: hypothetical protein WC682_04080 [Parcubacteria group bacterium]|jgi:hypothetical protein
MKRAQCFISKYSQLLKLGMWIGIIFWATQLGGQVWKIHQDNNLVPELTASERETVNKELLSFYENLLSVAKSKGENYGPKDYFIDLRLIEKKTEEIQQKYAMGSIWSRYASELQSMSMRNIERPNSKFTHQQISDEARKYSDELKNATSIEFHEKFRSMSFSEKQEAVKQFCRLNLPKLISWIFILYVRGTLLAWCLFSLRMCERKGILATILSDKKRFALAMIFWPFLLAKYPANVIREIVVEAELRRIGNFFRRLTTEEKELVRHVAQSRGFLGWIRQFHKDNVCLFQRSFAMALVAVAIVNFVHIEESKADEINSIRAGTSIQMEISQDDNADCTSLKSKFFKTDVDYAIFLEKNLNIVTPAGISGLVVFMERIFRKQEFVRKIDHIPIC